MVGELERIWNESLIVVQFETQACGTEDNQEDS
jgi:hypothetical protein